MTITTDHSRGLTGWFSDRVQKARASKIRKQVAGMSDRDATMRFLTETKGYAADDAAELVLNAELKSMFEGKPDIADRIESVTIVGHNTPPASFLSQVSHILHPSYAGESIDPAWFTALEKVSAFVREHGRVPELQLTY